MNLQPIPLETSLVDVNTFKAERSPSNDERGGVSLIPGNLATSATGNVPNPHLAGHRAISNPDGYAYGTGIAGLRYSTSAQPLPPPSTPSDVSIWDPN
jgi:hypothetical protein